MAELEAVQEDLAEWLRALGEDRHQDGDQDLLGRLETGVVLCRLAARLGGRPVAHRAEVQPGTFHARDNVHNFIAWCRGSLGVRECLLFETDDLVMRKNERSVLLCLLEVARKGAQRGAPAPTLVRMERQMDGEEPGEPSLLPDLPSLHQRVAELLGRCSCPEPFPMAELGDGKYRVGKTLIFVRILRDHVMVRVGGGWDTLDHYLEKHDPCRCGNRSSGRRIRSLRHNMSPSSTDLSQLHIRYYDSCRRPSSMSSSPARRRPCSVDLTSTSTARRRFSSTSASTRTSPRRRMVASRSETSLPPSPVRDQHRSPSRIPVRTWR